MRQSREHKKDQLNKVAASRKLVDSVLSQLFDKMERFSDSFRYGSQCYVTYVFYKKGKRGDVLEKVVDDPATGWLGIKQLDQDGRIVSAPELRSKAAIISYVVLSPDRTKVLEVYFLDLARMIKRAMNAQLYELQTVYGETLKNGKQFWLQSYKFQFADLPDECFVKFSGENLPTELSSLNRKGDTQ